jgi:SAM-dependent methyltransferase
MTSHRHEHDDRSTARYWDDFYAEKDAVWSGKPNDLLVRYAADLSPGTALDLGCGEGGDALWLADRGWQVTAVDVSEVALRRGAAHAADAGVESRITWQRHDLAESFPDGTFDLVSAQFLHSPVAEDGEREDVLRRALSAVAPGGVLLVGSHAGWPSWVDSPPFEHRFPTVSEVVTALRLPPRDWTVEVAELVETTLPDPEGEPGHRTDSVVRVRRH